MTQELTPILPDNDIVSMGNETDDKVSVRRDIGKNPHAGLARRRNFHKNNRKKTTEIVENKENTMS